MKLRTDEQTVEPLRGTDGGVAIELLCPCGHMLSYDAPNASKERAPRRVLSQIFSADEKVLGR